MSTTPPGALRPVPGWALVSAVVGPVAFVLGWLYAGSTVRGYDPVRQSTSVLAAGDAPHRWVMTLALVVAGLAYVVTAFGLRPADPTGRAILGVGGVATLLMAWIPNPHANHNSVGHMISSYLAFAALSLWPAVIARNVPEAPAVLRPEFGKTAAIVLGVLFLVLVAAIIPGSATLGLRERVLMTGQAVMPLVVVLGVVRLPARRLAEPALHH